MSYTLPMWEDRYRSRVDITSTLTHLTKEAKVDGKDESAIGVLVRILRDQCINGSSRTSGVIVGNPFFQPVPKSCFVLGKRPAVCFLDVPLLGLAQHIAYERKRVEQCEDRVRYRGVGLMFDKRYAFEKGARPAIYESTDVAKDLVNDEKQHWRIVPLDLRNPSNLIDWTHEREWRAPGSFTFTLDRVTLLVESTEEYKELFALVPTIAQKVVAVHVLNRLLG